MLSIVHVIYGALMLTLSYYTNLPAKISHLWSNLPSTLPSTDGCEEEAVLTSSPDPAPARRRQGHQHPQNLHWTGPFVLEPISEEFVLVEPMVKGSVSYDATLDYITRNVFTTESAAPDLAGPLTGRDLMQYPFTTQPVEPGPINRFVETYPWQLTAIVLSLLSLYVFRLLTAKPNQGTLISHFSISKTTREQNKTEFETAVSDFESKKIAFEKDKEEFKTTQRLRYAEYQKATKAVMDDHRNKLINSENKILSLHENLEKEREQTRDARVAAQIAAAKLQDSENMALVAIASGKATEQSMFVLKEQSDQAVKAAAVLEQRLRALSKDSRDETLKQLTKLTAYMDEIPTYEAIERAFANNHIIIEELQNSLADCETGVEKVRQSLETCEAELASTKQELVISKSDTESAKERLELAEVTAAKQLSDIATLINASEKSSKAIVERLHQVSDDYISKGQNLQACQDHATQQHSQIEILSVKPIYTDDGTQTKNVSVASISLHEPVEERIAEAEEASAAFNADDICPPIVIAQQETIKQKQGTPPKSSPQEEPVPVFQPFWQRNDHGGVQANIFAVTKWRWTVAHHQKIENASAATTNIAEQLTAEADAQMKDIVNSESIAEPRRTSPRLPDTKYGEEPDLLWDNHSGKSSINLMDFNVPTPNERPPLDDAKTSQAEMHPPKDASGGIIDSAISSVFEEERKDGNKSLFTKPSEHSSVHNPLESEHSYLESDRPETEDIASDASTDRAEEFDNVSDSNSDNAKPFLRSETCPRKIFPNHKLDQPGKAGTLDDLDSDSANPKTAGEPTSLITADSDDESNIPIIIKSHGRKMATPTSRSSKALISSLGVSRWVSKETSPDVSSVRAAAETTLSPLKLPSVSTATAPSASLDTSKWELKATSVRSPDVSPTDLVTRPIPAPSKSDKGVMTDADHKALADGFRRLLIGSENRAAAKHAANIAAANNSSQPVNKTEPVAGMALNTHRPSKINLLGEHVDQDMDGVEPTVNKHVVSNYLAAETAITHTFDKPMYELEPTSDLPLEQDKSAQEVPELSKDTEMETFDDGTVADPSKQEIGQIAPDEQFGISTAEPATAQLYGPDESFNFATDQNSTETGFNGQDASSSTYNPKRVSKEIEKDPSVLDEKPLINANGRLVKPGHKHGSDDERGPLLEGAEASEDGAEASTESMIPSGEVAQSAQPIEASSQTQGFDMFNSLTTDEFDFNQSVQTNTTAPPATTVPQDDQPLRLDTTIPPPVPVITPPRENRSKLPRPIVSPLARLASQSPLNKSPGVVSPVTSNAQAIPTNIITNLPMHPHRPRRSSTAELSASEDAESPRTQPGSPSSHTPASALNTSTSTIPLSVSRPGSMAERSARRLAGECLHCGDNIHRTRNCPQNPRRARRGFRAKKHS